MRVVVLHAGGIAVALRGPDGRETGFALFSTGGLVALMGAAADQYQGLPPVGEPVHRPGGPS